MRTNLLADALSILRNGERAGKAECTIPASGVVEEVLRVMKERGYIRDYLREEETAGGRFRVALQGRINECGAIAPRHSVPRTEFEKWEKRFLPSRNFGVLILSTPRGVMTHAQARDAGTGGVLLAYVY
jgi:small subunit ribosomal protein S8